MVSIFLPPKLQMTAVIKSLWHTAATEHKAKNVLTWHEIHSTLK